MPPWLRRLSLVYLARLVRVRTSALDAARQPTTICSEALSLPQPSTTTAGILRRRSAGRHGLQQSERVGRKQVGYDDARTLSCQYAPLDGVVNDISAALTTTGNDVVGTPKFFAPGTETPHNGPSSLGLRVPSVVMSCGRRWRRQQQLHQRQRRTWLFDTTGSVVGNRLSRSGGDIGVGSFAKRSLPPSPRAVTVNADDDDDDDAVNETHLGEISDDRGPCGPVADDSDIIAAEWTELARVLDRTFFWLLFALMTMSAMVILLYPKYTGNEDSWTYSE